MQFAKMSDHTSANGQLALALSIATVKELIAAGIIGGALAARIVAATIELLPNQPNARDLEARSMARELEGEFGL